MPLTLSIEVLYAESRVAREAWLDDLREVLLEEMRSAECVADVAEKGGEADLWLSVSVSECSLEHGEGGEPYLDENSGRYRPGRSYLCRITLAYALLPDPDGEPLHTDGFTVAQREGTTSNPLFEPREHAYRRAMVQTARELRRHTCKRLPKIAKLLDRSAETSR